MGLFGNFDKPGKGVSKNRAPKRALFAFFELFIEKFWSLISANLLYIVVSLPVLTVGLANAGLTILTRNYTRRCHAYTFTDFIGAIKSNWKQALPVGIINMLINVVLVYDFMSFYLLSDGLLRISALVGLTLVFLVFSFMKYYMYLIMVTFRLPLRKLYRNSLNFAVLGIKNNLIITLVLGMFYGGAYLLLKYVAWYISVLVIFLVYVLIFPAFRAFLIQFCVFGTVRKYMIDPYYKANPDADLEQRRALHLIEEAQESIFQDTTTEGGEAE